MSSDATTIEYWRRIFASRLELIGVVDPGVPNSERVVIRPTGVVNLRGHGLTVGFPAQREGEALVIHDNVFWFPVMVIEEPAWLFVYTGRGTTRQTSADGVPAIVLHWQRPYTIFDVHENLVPVLFQAEAIQVGKRLPVRKPPPALLPESWPSKK